ncbi:MAG: hypothetical protein ABSD27_09550 [Bryobacteraceae bacterium]|jgi:hypothetical protein
MSEFRLGDDVDDFCVKCRRITNHSIVSVVQREPAKVRCRTCYNEHYYRRGEAPPRKDARKDALFKEVLSSINPSPAPAEAEEEKKPKARKKGG